MGHARRHGDEPRLACLAQGTRGGGLRCIAAHQLVAPQAARRPQAGPGTAPMASPLSRRSAPLRATREEQWLASELLKRREAVAEAFAHAFTCLPKWKVAEAAHKGPRHELLK